MENNPFFKTEENKKNYIVKRGQNNEWIESSFSKHSWIETQQEEDFFVGKSISASKINFFYIIAVTILIILASKSLYMQIVKGEEYARLSDFNKVRHLPMVAERGIIYDRNQKQLVYNIADFYLAIIPNDLPKEDEEKFYVMNTLSDIIKIPAKDIEEYLSQYSSYNYQSIPIKTNLTYDQALKLEILNNTYPALQVGIGIKREYNAPKSMSHILGFLRKLNGEDLKTYPNYFLTDDVGKAGIEYQYESTLRGTYGEKQIEVDALGRHTAILAKENSIPGKDIILAIDSELQKKAEEVLEKKLQDARLARGSIIISDPNNGEILTLVSLPTFDNNVFSGGLSVEDYADIIENPNKPLFNRSISGEYPSGSTVKMIFGTAALEEKIIDKNTTFVSSGGIKVGEWFFPDWKFGGHGTTNITKALAESVNTFFYIIGGGLLNKQMDDFIHPGLGVLKLTEYAKKFGLGSKLRIDLPGEASGFLPSKEWKERVKEESWYIGDTYHLAIGQGDLLVTPLQVNYWTNVFANKGILYEPHITKSIVNEDGSLNIIAPKILNQNFISLENINTIRSGLRDGVLYGSSRSLLSLGFTSAGKTGTAEWGTNKKPHAWWTGFAPYEDPQISITVLVEEGQEGSGISLQIAKEIMQWYFDR